MTVSSAGIALIKGDEGCSLVAIKDVNRWQIGWGDDFYPDGKAVREGDTCTQEQADAWFLMRINQFEDAVNGAVSVSLNQNQFDALVSLCENIGAQAFIDSTLVKDLNYGLFSPASTQFPRWNKVNGLPNAGLTKRRLAEQALFQHPISV